jgi:hypothetical protein
MLGADHTLRLIPSCHDQYAIADIGSMGQINSYLVMPMIVVVPAPCIASLHDLPLGAHALPGPLRQWYKAEAGDITTGASSGCFMQRLLHVRKTISCTKLKTYQFHGCSFAQVCCTYVGLGTWGVDALHA